MRRELMEMIVDEVFDGAIEDASVIEQIYDVIYRDEIINLKNLACRNHEGRRLDKIAIGAATEVLEKHGLMDEAKEAIRKAVEAKDDD